MVPIGDHTGRKTGIAELFPDVVRMAADHPMRAIAEVGAQSSSRVDGGGNLFTRGGCMSDRHRHSGRDHSANKIGRSGQLGGQSDQADAMPGNLLQLLKL